MNVDVAIHQLYDKSEEIITVINIFFCFIFSTLYNSYEINDASLTFNG
jgi:hypothetical protein